MFCTEVQVSAFENNFIFRRIVMEKSKKKAKRVDFNAL